MGIAQTNLQLYGQMIADGWSEGSLARTRAAYDVARQLFSDAYRPSHKPFVCHLVGTASAAARWRCPEAIVLAGLLHSAYLYGDFRDGERGPTARRRRFLVDTIGDGAESIVYRYSVARSSPTPNDRDVQLVRLADRFDELADAGPAFAIAKPSDATENRQQVLDEALGLVGPGAQEDFRVAYEALDRLGSLVGLSTSDLAYHRATPRTLPISRSPAGRRLRRWQNSLTKRLSA